MGLQFSLTIIFSFPFPFSLSAFLEIDFALYHLFYPSPSLLPPLLSADEFAPYFKKRT